MLPTLATLLSEGKLWSSCVRRTAAELQSLNNGMQKVIFTDLLGSASGPELKRAVL